MLSHVMHHKRSGASDSYDFVFTPQGGARPPAPLRFVYRYTHGHLASWGLVLGEPAPGFEVTYRRLAGLRHFDQSPIARDILERRANAEGVRWGNVSGGSRTIETDVLNQDDSNALDDIRKFLRRRDVRELREAGEKVGDPMLTTANAVWTVVRDLSGPIAAIAGIGAFAAALALLRREEEAEDEEEEEEESSD